MDKGAINDGHVLMVPIEHFPNTIGISPKAHAEMERYLTALSSCYAAEVRRRPLWLQAHPSNMTLVIPDCRPPFEDLVLASWCAHRMCPRGIAASPGTHAIPSQFRHERNL